MLVDLSQVAENGFGLKRENNAMDGIHDLGGKAGFGTVEVEAVSYTHLTLPTKA